MVLAVVVVRERVVPTLAARLPHHGLVLLHELVLQLLLPQAVATRLVVIPEGVPLEIALLVSVRVPVWIPVRIPVVRIPVRIAVDVPGVEDVSGAFSVPVPFPLAVMSL